MATNYETGIAILGDSNVHCLICMSPQVLLATNDDYLNGLCILLCIHA